MTNHEATEFTEKKSIDSSLVTLAPCVVNRISSSCRRVVVPVESSCRRVVVPVVSSWSNPLRPHPPSSSASLRVLLGGQSRGDEPPSSQRTPRDESIIFTFVLRDLGALRGEVDFVVSSWSKSLRPYPRFPIPYHLAQKNYLKSGHHLCDKETHTDRTKARLRENLLTGCESSDASGRLS
jgi:hypothetical protein